MNLLKDLTLKDSFLFGAVMILPENCKPLLERILGLPIEKISVSKEKSMIFVIFICDFDPFKMGRYRYTFRNLCLEEHSLDLPDGCTTIFLNTRGTNEDEVPEELALLLKYIGSDLAESQKDYGDPYIRQLQYAVRDVKASREMEARYMLLQEMLKDERKAGYAEGHAHSILELLSFKTGTVSEELRARILSLNDEAVLSQYLRSAYLVSSVEEFERLLP